MSFSQFWSLSPMNITTSHWYGKFKPGCSSLPYWVCQEVSCLSFYFVLCSGICLSCAIYFSAELNLCSRQPHGEAHIKTIFLIVDPNMDVNNVHWCSNLPLDVSITHTISPSLHCRCLPIHREKEQVNCQVLKALESIYVYYLSGSL